MPLFLISKGINHPGTHADIPRRKDNDRAHMEKRKSEGGREGAREDKQPSRKREWEEESHHQEDSTLKERPG